MSELVTPVEKKRKFSLFDNFITVSIVAYLMILVGQILGFFLITPTMAALIPGAYSLDVWLTAEMYLAFLGIWAVALLILVLIPRNRPILKGLGTKTKGNTLKMFAVGLGIGLGMNLFCAFIAILNGDISLSFHSFRPVSFILVFIAVLIQSAAEELVCRVFMYQRLVRRYGKPILAAFINAAFFALIHMTNPGVTVLAVLNIFFYGLLFSAMIIYMDSPWAAMGAHAAWNFCQNIILGLPNSGIVLPYSVFKLDAATAVDSFAYSVSFGLEGTIIASVVLLAVAGLIAWWGTKHKIVPTDIWNTAT
ncbi:MAG: CPBP family intramembrane metalloprotease [Oscillospiraceae bacterium]|nr:CPBP family intramembrane metalloprotease [Oscillospiraceae bacterium]